MSSSHHTLRQAEKNDFDFLYNLMKTTMKDHIVATWGAWDEEFQREYFTKKFDPTKTHVVIINDTDVGSIMISENEENIKIDRLFLLPEYQGQGIGSAIVSSLINQAREKKKPLTLTVIKANTRARKFYERLGLKIVDENTERHVLSSV